jgi:hypothetical protein
VLTHELQGETPNLDHFFTPERMAEVEKSLADADSGNVFTMDQSKADLARHREEWLRQHPNVK